MSFIDQSNTPFFGTLLRHRLEPLSPAEDSSIQKDSPEVVLTARSASDNRMTSFLKKYLTGGGIALLILLITVVSYFYTEVSRLQSTISQLETEVLRLSSVEAACPFSGAQRHPILKQSLNPAPLKSYRERFYYFLVNF